MNVVAQPQPQPAARPPRSTLSPRERLLRTLRGQRADRVPLMLSFASAAGSYERLLAQRTQPHTTFAVSVPTHINRYLVTPRQFIHTQQKDLADGYRRTEGILDTPKGPLTFVTEWDPQSATEWTKKYPVESLSDLDKVAAVKWELPAGLAPLDKATLPADFATRGFVNAHISSPFVCVAGLMSYEQFLELCATDLERIQELTQVCLGRILEILRVLLPASQPECVWMGGSEWLTPPMASPRIYDTLVQAQEKAIIDYVHRHSAAVVHVHCHGRVRDALPKMIARGADFTEPVEAPPDGDITLCEAKALAAGRITLGGNIEARILCNETEEEVERACRAAFEGGKERFIFSGTDRPSPRIREQEYRNYLRLFEVWEELSGL